MFLAFRSERMLIFVISIFGDRRLAKRFRKGSGKKKCMNRTHRTSTGRCLRDPQIRYRDTRPLAHARFPWSNCGTSSTGNLLSDRESRRHASRSSPPRSFIPESRLILEFRQDHSCHQCTLHSDHRSNITLQQGLL